MVLAIIGGGPAGYVAAITAAQQGESVILIEQKELGGTCLNEGCIPTKGLLASAEMFEKVKNAGEFGVTVPFGQVEIDWNGVQDRKNAIVTKLVQGVSYLMKNNKIKILKGKASFLNDHMVQVENGVTKEEIKAEQFLIASGSEPVELPFAPFDDEWIIHSGQAMSLPSIPSSLLIIGGGVIGCEFASIYGRLGTKVTIVEMAEQIIPGEDSDISSVLHDELEKNGVTIYTSTSLKYLNSERKQAVLQNKESSFELSADYVLVSIGRTPRTIGLNLEKIGVQFSKSGIEVNKHMQTSLPHIYACGDVVGGIQLAHVAFHEGTVAALHACGNNAAVNYRAVPRCVYTSPEIASVGLTEKQAREKYGNIRIGEFPFAANGKAIIMNEESGKVKVIVDPEINEILGISIVGPHATELIGQGTIMLHAEITTDILEGFIAAHPTLSEAIHEALLSTVGHAVHA